MGIIGRFRQREGRDRIRLIKPDAKHRMGEKRQNATAFSGNSISISSPQERKNRFPESPFGVVKATKNSADQTTGRLGLIVEIDNATASVVRNEIMNLLNSKSNHSCTVLEMANALAISDECRRSHSKIDEKRNGLFANTTIRNFKDNVRVTLDWGKSSSRTNSRQMGNSRILDRFNMIFSRKTEKESMQSRYE